MATPAGLPRRFGAYFFDSVIITLAVAAMYYSLLGFENGLAEFLRSAPDYVATHTPRDHETRYLEARVTAWHNDDPPRVEVFRSQVR